LSFPFLFISLLQGKFSASFGKKQGIFMFFVFFERFSKKKRIFATAIQKDTDEVFKCFY